MTESERSPMKVCLRCRTPKPLTEFGQNKYYLKWGAKDGRAVYCKACNHTTTLERRAEERREREVGRKPTVFMPRPKRKTGAEIVLEAIAAGCRTREQIAARAKLEIDTVGNILADLAFTQSLVRVVRVGEEREFHLAA